jgi:hypothetical protein
VLVAYFDKKTDVPDKVSVEAAIREVCEDNPGSGASNAIVLIVANADAHPTSASSLRAIHEHVVVGPGGASTSWSAATSG